MNADTAKARTIIEQSEPLTKVLVVDDDPTLRAELRKYLESQGLRVDMAATPDEAERLLKNNSYHIVFADVNYGNSTKSGDDFILDNKDLLSKSQPIIITGDSLHRIKRLEELASLNVPIIEKGSDSFYRILDEISQSLEQNQAATKNVRTSSTDEVSKLDNPVNKSIDRDSPYPSGITLLHTLEGHTDWIGRLAWSPDGKMLATPSNDKSIRIWDAESGSLLHPFDNLSFQIISVAWSPDGLFLAAASKGVIHIYDMKLRTLLHTLNAPHSDRLVTCAEWSPDGKYLASTSRNGTIQIWNTSIWETDKTLKGEADWCLSLAWSPDSQRLAAADGNKLRIWNVETEEKVDCNGHEDQITSLIWLKDSDAIITASADKTLRIWDTNTNRQRSVLTGHAARIPSISVSCDQSLLASKSTDGTVKLWRLDTSEMIATIEEFAETPTGLYQVGIAFSPKGAVLASLGNENNAVRVWKLNLGDLLKPDIESILPANVNDQPTPQDSFGFSPYVRAVADFLINDKTHPPLTISVEGEWGCGKSSFMIQLENELRRRTTIQKVRALLSARKSIALQKAINPVPCDFKFFRQFLAVPLAARKNARQFTYPPIIRFNAWRHDKDVSLWASFALELVRKLSEGLPLRTRLLAKIKLLLRRFRWKDGWTVILRALSVAFVFVAISMVLIYFMYSGGIERLVKPAEKNGETTTSSSTSGKSEKTEPSNLDADEIFFLLIKGSGLIGYIAVFMYLLTKFKGLIGDPLSFNLRQYIKSPDYDSHVALIENFHEDFKKIIETYAGQNKVYVFIDDLDRCDIPKAADLMQAINLLTSDSPQIIFIIGMDREKIAASLAVKYEKIVPLLSPAATNITSSNGYENASGQNAGRANPPYGLEFGYNFIEKFIQIPFRIPQPAKLAFENLLNDISPIPKLATQLQTVDAKQSLQAVSPEDSNGNDASQGVEEVNTANAMPGDRRVPSSSNTNAGMQEEYREKIKLLVTNDSVTVRNIVLMVAPALDYNPRRLKQFINMFRLKALIAAETGMFGEQTLSSNSRSMTLQQLGKFVAISSRWPRLLADLEEERSLLRTLQGWAVNGQSVPSNSRAYFWTQFAELKNLLSFGCNENEQYDPFDSNKLSDVRKYSLHNIDIDKLLQVSPQNRNRF